MREKNVMKNTKKITLFSSPICALVCLFSFQAESSSVELDWEHYLSPAAQPTQQNDYFFLRWDQNLSFKYRSFYFDTSLKAEYDIFGKEIYYFSLPELYFLYEYKLKEPFYSLQSIELNVGRKIKKWSHADEYWKLGLWNPMNSWNPLHPSFNGLIGSLLSLKAERWSFDFFLGALYLPNQEPQLLNRDGKIYSHSRWHDPLPSKLANSNIDIDFLIQSPFVLEILLQQSYLASLKLHSKKSSPFRYWLKWSVGDKPVNHLFPIKNRDTLLVDEKNEDQSLSIDQSLSALSLRQRIFSMEWAWAYQSFSSVFSLEHTQIKTTDTLDEDWDFIHQREDFTFFSAFLKYDLFEKGFVRLGFLHSWFKNFKRSQIKSGGEEVQVPSILERAPILNGLALDGELEFLSQKELKRLLALSYRYSFSNKAGHLSLKALYYITAQMYAQAGCDIIGARGLNRGNGGKELYFLNRFKHNDYFSMRLGYDF